MADNRESAPPPKAAPGTDIARIMSRQMHIYYANCAMVATSPKDVAVMFGRYVPTSEEGGGQRMAELYERQIYMTLEQADELARALTRTVEIMKSRRKP